MGVACSSGPIAPMDLEKLVEQDHRIDENLQYYHERESEKIKLLLLGAGESGKSTIMKQIRILYGLQLLESECLSYLPTIRQNILQGLNILLAQAEAYGVLQDIACKEELSMITSFSPDKSKWTPEFGRAITVFFHDKAIQHVWSMKSNFQISESCEYYFENAEYIGNPLYIPSNRDILMCRVRTCGVITELFDIDGTPFEVYDVGGQRNERKKWIHCFDNVTAVFFLAALSEYDQKMAEDNETNRLIESLNLFEDICKNKYFKNAPIILFLNKKDLFQQKIARIPINSVAEFSDFNGPENDYESSVKYFLDKFLERARASGKKVHYHISCAVDTKNTSVILEACKDTILRSSMDGFNL